MSTLTALPVSSGDAFLLEKDTKTVLIDGGGSQRKILQLLKKNNVQKIDILVCTHNDSDHANGIIGILKNETILIDQLWLPDVFKKTFDLIQFENIQKIHIKHKSADDEYSFEYSFNAVSLIDTLINLPALDPDKIKICETIARLSNEIFIQKEKNQISLYGFFNGNFKKIWRRKSIDTLNQYLMTLQKNIIEIYTLAKKSNRVNKIFFINQCNSVILLNDKQIRTSNENEAHQDPPNNLQKELFLYLTRSNIESLVLYAPGNKGEAGVLFTADSDFSKFSNTLQLPSVLPENLIVTAPHHGSESNKEVYKIINNLGIKGNIFWVRSDCLSSSRPGKTFQKQTYRMCTQCTKCQKKGPNQIQINLKNLNSAKNYLC